jgi:hypothetical protein
MRLPSGIPDDDDHHPFNAGCNCGRSSDGSDDGSGDRSDDGNENEIEHEEGCRYAYQGYHSRVISREQLKVRL